jgi:hypothetical protein
MKENRSF